MLFTLEMTHFTGYLQVNWGSVILARLKPTHWLPACGNRAALPSGFWNRTGSFFFISLSHVCSHPSRPQRDPIIERQ